MTGSRTQWRSIAIVAVGAAYFIAAIVSVQLSHMLGRVAILWIPNAIVLAAVLCTGRRRWPALLASGGAASFAANMAVDHDAVAGFIATTANLVEITIAAVLTRRWAGPLPLFDRVTGVVRFSVVAGLVAPAIAATVAAVGVAAFETTHAAGGLGRIWYRWFVGDGLGLLIGTPVLLIAWDLWRRGPDPILAQRSRLEIVLLLGMVLAGALGVFGLTTKPTLFLLMPLVLAAVFRLGPLGAALACVGIAAAGMWFTAHDIGPATFFPGTMPERILYLQMFLALLFVSALPVAAALAERQALATDLEAARDAARRAADLFYAEASTDALTQVATRRRFLERLEEEVATARRSGQPLALAVFDLDRFKQINDGHGHPAGDEVLRIVTGIARRVLRTDDIVGRLGGEEFAVLMPRTTREAAAAACERLRAAVAADPIPLPSGAAVTATVSLGLVLGAERNGAQLLHEADRALYEAKQAGRNRLAIAA